MKNFIYECIGIMILHIPIFIIFGICGFLLCSPGMTLAIEPPIPIPSINGEIKHIYEPVETSMPAEIIEKDSSDRPFLSGILLLIFLFLMLIFGIIVALSPSHNKYEINYWTKNLESTIDNVTKETIEFVQKINNDRYGSEQNYLIHSPSWQKEQEKNHAIREQIRILPKNPHSDRRQFKDVKVNEWFQIDGSFKSYEKITESGYFFDGSSSRAELFCCQTQIVTVVPSPREIKIKRFVELKYGDKFVIPGFDTKYSKHSYRYYGENVYQSMWMDDLDTQVQLI